MKTEKGVIKKLKKRGRRVKRQLRLKTERMDINLITIMTRDKIVMTALVTMRIRIIVLLQTLLRQIGHL